MRRMLKAAWACVCGMGCVLNCGTVQPQTSYPMLMSVQPIAVQVGQTSEVTLRSRYSMAGAYQVLVSGDGVTGEVVPPEDSAQANGSPKPMESLKVRLTVAADATLGPRDIRIAGPTGASTVGQFVVVADPVIREQGNNDTLQQANPINVPCTVCGTIEKAEDIDWYKFSVEAGKTLVFHTWAMRLQDRIHDLQQHADPIITICDSHANTIVQMDNTLAADPMFVHTFQQSGEYFLMVRDVRFLGNAYWEYCIEIFDRPLPLSGHPLAVAPGGSSSVQLLGPLVPAEPVTLTVPSVPEGAWQVAHPAGPLTHPVRLLVSRLPVVVEEQDAGGEVTSALAVSVPSCIAGRVGQPSDVDVYRFEATKGQAFTVEVFAQRFGSFLDAHLRILDGQGRQVAQADDSRVGHRSTRDARLDSWTAPSDGSYFIEIRDVHLRGSDWMPYVVRMEPALPSFRLLLDTDKTQLTPGTAGVLFVRAERINGFDGEIRLAVDGLPPGVTAHAGRILPGKGQDGCIVFEAAPDAAPAASNIRVWGEAVVQRGEQSYDLRVDAISYQEIYQPGGGRGHWPVDNHTVAIGAPSDIRAVKVSTQQITLKPGETARIDVHIERAQGFDKNVTLDVQFRHLNTVYGDPLPPGVTLDVKQSKTLLTGNESDGYITLVAAKDAPSVENQIIAVMANVSINFVMKATYSSPPVTVSIAAE